MSGSCPILCIYINTLHTFLPYSIMIFVSQWTKSQKLLLLLRWYSTLVHIFWLLPLYSHKTIARCLANRNRLNLVDCLNVCAPAESERTMQYLQKMIDLLDLMTKRLHCSEQIKYLCTYTFFRLGSLVCVRSSQTKTRLCHDFPAAPTRSTRLSYSGSLAKCLTNVCSSLTISQGDR